MGVSTGTSLLEMPLMDQPTDQSKQSSVSTPCEKTAHTIINIATNVFMSAGGLLVAAGFPTLFVASKNYAMAMWLAGAGSAVIGMTIKAIRDAITPSTEPNVTQAASTDTTPSRTTAKPSSYYGTTDDGLPCHK